MVTLDELFGPYAPSQYRYAGYYEQTAYLMGARPGEARYEAIEVKYSRGFVEHIERYFAEFAFRFEDIVFRSLEVCPADKLREQTFTEGRPFSFAVALNRVRAYISKCCSEFFDAHANAIKNLISDESEDTLLAREVNVRFHDLSAEFRGRR